MNCSAGINLSKAFTASAFFFPYEILHMTNIPIYFTNACLRFATDLCAENTAVNRTGDMRAMFPQRLDDIEET